MTATHMKEKIYRFLGPATHDCIKTIGAQTVRTSLVHEFAKRVPPLSASQLTEALVEFDKP